MMAIVLGPKICRFIYSTKLTFPLKESIKSKTLYRRIHRINAEVFFYRYQGEYLHEGRMFSGLVAALLLKHN